ncbi:YcnI family protein [Uliginosibacterium sp. H3]|uniref:YcnI family protein n=1 Tax=Uliginosibacterium silvisoli TaxID=3114758 RepID=A0ABU6K746_9RHOO|nr:YcnI family protein [Uliginosibacterium sp. H3]
MLKKFATALLCTAACLSNAQAHITLEQKSAVSGTSYKSIFRVGHGCDGSPTTNITVFLPEGFVGAKPMPKAGWKLDIKTEKLDKPYLSHGKPVSERAAQFSWSGGRLLDAEYDEFVIAVTVPESAGKRWIRVLQQCEKGQNDWAEIPVEGQEKPRFPAALLDIVPAAPVAGHEHHH